MASLFNRFIAGESCGLECPSSIDEVAFWDPTGNTTVLVFAAWLLVLVLWKSLPSASETACKGAFIADLGMFLDVSFKFMCFCPPKAGLFMGNHSGSSSKTRVFADLAAATRQGKSRAGSSAGSSAGSIDPALDPALDPSLDPALDTRKQKTRNREQETKN